MAALTLTAKGAMEDADLISIVQWEFQDFLPEKQAQPKGEEHLQGREVLPASQAAPSRSTPLASRGVSLLHGGGRHALPGPVALWMLSQCPLA